MECNSFRMRKKGRVWREWYSMFVECGEGSRGSERVDAWQVVCDECTHIVQRSNHSSRTLAHTLPIRHTHLHLVRCFFAALASYTQVCVVRVVLDVYALYV